ncbi:MAG: hypothetical protein JXR73_03640 [Candidatus Omnitrophica bacterium]|nr:hypothetical protein [Candidatus Omnitrophota bacterium]
MMIKHARFAIFPFFALVFWGVELPCLAQNADAPPPVPGRLLTVIQDKYHPFLLADSGEFREAKKTMRKDIFRDRRKEFEQRILGYFNPDSKWNLGEGPLSENADFHPAQLSDADFLFYLKVMGELMTYTGIEKEKWAIAGLKREFLRILDEIAPTSDASSAVMLNKTIDDRRIQLLAVAALTYDLVYNRFSTIERHPLNNRLNQLRLILASDCAAVDPAARPIQSRLHRGAALGLATILCISIYPYEWEKEQRFSEQSFLPDLYRAITYTHSGVKGMGALSPHIPMPLAELESVLLTAIPWLDCLKRMGYPYQLQKGFYPQIFQSFETHRAPDSVNMIQPFLPAALYDPWIPRSQPIFTMTPDSMYVQEKDNQETFVPFKQQKKSEIFIASENPFNIPESLQQTDINIQRGSGRAMSLRESFERYGYPKKPTPIPLPEEERVSNPDAGWTPPDGLVLPTIWGALYLLTEQDDPQSLAGEIWEEQAIDIDSHPYTFLYYRPFPVRSSKSRRESTLIDYPEFRSTIMTSISPRGEYMLASQAASETLILPTYAIDHESFLYSEEGSEWRWFHEIPSSTHTESATASLEIPAEQANPAPIRHATPFITSLFSCWETYSPAGRTIVVRRHLGGVGSGYSAIAHFPDEKESDKRIQYIIFSVPENGRGIPSDEVSDFYSIHPSEEQLENRPMNFATFRMERRDERESSRRAAMSSVLKVLFNPGGMNPANAFTGALNKIYELELREPDQPFFYLCSQDMPGREMYEVKYASVPLPGLRILEWKQGIEIIAMRTGDKIQNAFVESDADFIIVMRDSSMRGVFYLMVNGSYLHVKFAPTQSSFTLLADNLEEKITAAWCQRRIYTTSPPKDKSRFYAPGVLGFECPDFVIQYGQKGNMGVVWDSKPDPRKRSR